MSWRIGVDIGGTFTDLVMAEVESGRICNEKVLTTPADPSQGVLAGIELILKNNRVPASAVQTVIHGTTLVANALIERKGVPTALVTTAGFRDVLEIGREWRYDIYDLFLTPVQSLVPRSRRFEVRERVGYDGGVIEPLDLDGLARVASDIAASGVQAVAVCFLHSFKRADHELQAKQFLEARLPHVTVCISSEVMPEIGEYERTATTLANAYVGPKLIGYLDRLGTRLAEGGYRYPLLLAHCMGGLTTMEEIRVRPLLTLDSGPVSGVLGSRYFGAVYGELDIICADMGGTTFDVALIEGGKYILEEEPVIDRYTCLLPKVAVESVGAGGGSIVWCDENGLLRVGPHSAGAEPGPACYGAGGSAPTITDVNLVLGYLSPEAFLGGEMRLDRAAAERALARVAAPAGMDSMQAAAGAFRIVNANMADLIRRSSIDRGRDARDFVLFAYGGAGALHVAYLARDLGIAKIYVPSFATVFSALGMLTGGIVHSAERSSLASFPLSPQRWRELGGMFESLEQGLGELFGREGIAPEERRYARFAHVKYRLQPRALAVPVTEDFAAPDSQQRLLAAFQRQYAALYGENAGYGAASIEVVKCRIEGSAEMVLPRLAAVPMVEACDASPAKKGSRDIYLTEPGAMVSASIYDGERLAPGMRLAGPAVIERMGDTILLPGFTLGMVDGFGNIVIELQAEAK